MREMRLNEIAEAMGAPMNPTGSRLDSVLSDGGLTQNESRTEQVVQQSVDRGYYHANIGGYPEELCRAG
jgi:hypothetical protein